MKNSGEETYANLNCLKHTIYDQLSEIHTINIGLVEFTVQFKVTGDMMFITKIFGHSGPGSVFPCCICNVPKSELRNISKFELRTHERMVKYGTEFQLQVP